MRARRRLVSPAPLWPVADPPPEDRARGWVITAVLTCVAAVLRFVRLEQPTDRGTPVFDEKYYAAQAWEMLTNGMGIDDNPAFPVIVHPPVGKLLIAVGEAIFGYTPLGWRFSAAVAGTVLVLLVVRIVRRLSRSTLIGAIAGILLIADGVTFVSSRIGMLDIFLALFVTAAFGCLVVDRDELRVRLTEGVPHGVRWWRFGAGVLLGLACGTKWSGAYFALAFLILSLGLEFAVRREVGIHGRRPGVLLRDAAAALFVLVVVPTALYVASYAGWFASETGINRYAVGGDSGFFAFLPDALRSLWFNHARILDFHVTLTNSAGYHHDWESKPWTWPMGLRPMLYYYPDPTQTTGCGASACVRAIMLVGTPTIWWLAVPVLGWALWRSVVGRDWRHCALLVGYGAAWLPWFATLDRQMYFFYATAMAPFLIMMMALALGGILGRARDSTERRGLGLLIVCLYLGMVVANFAWLYPILTAMPITPAVWQQQLWLPSWR
ncbi:phospholipid carrier-dependent glycosyltransferase [Nocardia sp. CC201C]|uniref:dolichyl-phosphate-mannose--protein mannosyltransferase n=1 Tax=Nocardia sp. CC201C TaxID=3044575 RepID=UPI0024A9310E|nr:phospholipid carrier-dependent glycosyltransferase [Nocardia sp. CC201C]